jgi:hypothetical protein
MSEMLNELLSLNPWICIGLFAAYVAIDYLCVKHIIYSQSRRTAKKAAWVSVAISGLGALSTVEFVPHPWYIVPILAGVWVGTYLATILSNPGEK